VTQSYLADTPRDAIKAKLTELWNYERFGVQTVHAGRYCYTRNEGLPTQSPATEGSESQSPCHAGIRPPRRRRPLHPQARSLDFPVASMASRN